MDAPLYHYVKGKGWVTNDERLIVSCRKNGRSFVVEKRKPERGESFCLGFKDITELESHISTFNWRMGINKYDPDDIRYNSGVYYYTFIEELV